MHDQDIRIVIAEDDFLVCEEVKRILRGSHYKVIGEACNGEEAVEMASALHPDLILMDIKMPKMDGLEASRRISEENPCPIIILTAYESSELVEQASQAGVGAFLNKPPQFAEIDRAITIAMARHQDLMEMRQLNKKLQNALEEIKTLKGFLPVCCVCGIIRDDTGCEHGKGVWMKMDQFIVKKTRAKISHTYCPECYKKAMEG